MRRRLPFVLVLALCVLSWRTAAQTHPEAWFELPVRDGWRTLSGYGITREERALSLTLIARAMYGRDRGSDAPTPAMRLERARSAEQPAVGDVASPSVTIPAPFSEPIWRSLLDLQTNDDLFWVLVRDRNAMWLCMGATATDASVRSLLGRDSDLLRSIYRETAGTFATTARSLRIEGSVVVVPGGATLARAWQELADESPAKPAAFIRALLSRDRGRLAWFYDTVAGLSAERLASIVGSARDEQRDRLRALYASFQTADEHWRIEEFPFARGMADPWTIVTQVDVDDRGVAGPSWSRLWRALFANETLTADEWRKTAPADKAPMSLPWLTREIVAAAPQERRDRFEMVRLAQRVFPEAADRDAPDIALALAGYRRHRALLLTLERVGIASPQTWARVVRAAQHVDAQSSEEHHAPVLALQGALALIERVRLARTIDATTATALIDSLSAAVVGGAPVHRAVRSWIVDALVPALPPLHVPDRWTGRTAYESTILQAMAGPRKSERPTLAWEGLSYAVDLYEGELERLTRIRSLLVSPGLDAAIENGDETDLATALRALAYASALGDPDGIVTLASDAPERHVFGFAAPNPDHRRTLPWSLPREVSFDGKPWHVEGSLLALDLGLARLSLRRLADQQMPLAPSLNLNDLRTLARTIAALNPHDLTTHDRDLVVAAMARGRARVQAAIGAGESLTTLARAVRMSSARRELLPWIAAHDPDALAAQFSLRDLLWLGRPELSADRLDLWGLEGRPLDGRLTTLMPTSAPWEDFGGRSDAGQISTQVPDLTLRLAEETARLQLPPALIPALLAYAVQEYWHAVDARFADDWPAMSRAARDLASSDVEDYVAALTGRGPLRVP